METNAWCIVCVREKKITALLGYFESISSFPASSSSDKKKERP